MTPLIACQDLRKTYRLGGSDVKALDGVSLTIEPGAYVAVTGASGSGKSTFMNLLGALDSPTSGGLTVAGRDLVHLGPGKLADFRNEVVGFVFQTFNLLARTSALDNVILPLLYARRKTPDHRQRARNCLDRVGLSDRTGHHPSQLSGGQQQRVAIARALVNEPAILLADEPTGALDSKTSNDIMDLFEDLNRDGITILLVTHERDIAARARRRLEFRDGRIVEDRS
ncbi:MAG: ABC transporter ATP-binding protein [Magnetospiraceae bacterium]